MGFYDRFEAIHLTEVGHKLFQGSISTIGLQEALKSIARMLPQPIDFLYGLDRPFIPANDERGKAPFS